MDPETRAYLDAFRAEFRELRADVSEVRAQMLLVMRDDLQAQIDGLRQEVRATAAETRRHFDVMAEALRHDLRALAEGVAMNAEAIERVPVVLRQEMDERFRVVDLAFASVRRDIGDLRGRLN
jgi:hypothetical protein